VGCYPKIVSLVVYFFLQLLPAAALDRRMAWLRVLLAQSLKLPIHPG
jgi:hypothetical protein